MVILMLIVHAGMGYGGYATLMGLTFTPEVFQCGADVGGATNLITFLEAIADADAQTDMQRMIGGDLTTEDGLRTVSCTSNGSFSGRQFLMSRSPLFKADQLLRPLLIVQGVDDASVRQADTGSWIGGSEKHAICYRRLCGRTES
jgi:dipeptidyl aminopeptidase/acylaminoacyl peptidase